MGHARAELGQSACQVCRAGWARPRVNLGGYYAAQVTEHRMRGGYCHPSPDMPPNKRAM